MVLPVGVSRIPVSCFDKYSQARNKCNLLHSGPQHLDAESRDDQQLWRSTPLSERDLQKSFIVIIVDLELVQARLTVQESCYRSKLLVATLEKQSKSLKCKSSPGTSSQRFLHLVDRTLILIEYLVGSRKSIWVIKQTSSALILSYVPHHETKP